MKQFVNSVLVSACLCFGPFALADGEVEAQYRKSVMKSVGGHMSSMAVSYTHLTLPTKLEV